MNQCCENVKTPFCPTCGARIQKAEGTPEALLSYLKRYIALNHLGNLVKWTAWRDWVKEAIEREKRSHWDNVEHDQPGDGPGYDAHCTCGQTTDFDHTCPRCDHLCHIGRCRQLGCDCVTTVLSDAPEIEPKEFPKCGLCGLRIRPCACQPEPPDDQPAEENTCANCGHRMAIHNAFGCTGCECLECPREAERTACRSKGKVATCGKCGKHWCLTCDGETCVHCAGTTILRNIPKSEKERTAKPPS